MCPFISALFVHPSPAVCRPNDLITQLGGSNKSEHCTPSFTENKLIVHWDKVQVKVTRLTPGGPPEGRRNGPFNSHPRPPPLQTRIRGWGGSWNGMRGGFCQMGCFKKTTNYIHCQCAVFPSQTTALHQYLSNTSGENRTFSPLFTAQKKKQFYILRLMFCCTFDVFVM